MRSDITISHARRVRFAPVVQTTEGPAHVGPLLSLSRNKDDFYISLRFSPHDTKISLHASGITRWAKIDLNPRAPIFRGTLADLEERRWHTVFRAIYIPYFNDFLCGNLPENNIKFEGLTIPGLNKQQCVVYSFGYLATSNIDLLECANIEINSNLHIFSLSDEKRALAVLTGSYYSFEEMVSAFSQFRREPLTYQDRIIWKSIENGPYTLITQFVSQVYTHSFLFLHSIPEEISVGSAVNHHALKLCGLVEG